jgi:OmpA-OmpF porin, OOP family
MLKRHNIIYAQAFIRAMNQSRTCRSLLSVLVSLFLFSSVSAQMRLEAMGGIQSTNFIQKNSIPGFDTIVGKYYSPKTGFELGFLAEIPLGQNFYLQPGVLFSTKGNQFEIIKDSSVFHYDTIYDQHTLKLSYVEMPVYLTWKIALSKTKKSQFFMSAGVYFAFINSASQDYQTRIKQYNSSKYIYNAGTEDLPVGSGTGKYKTYDIGLTTKAGFELDNVILGAYFSQGITNAYSATYPSNFHNQVIGGSIGIWLNKAKPANLSPKDSDKDGTPDQDDSCKTVPGSPRYHGCPIPDTDHDGINDEEDSCKTNPGPRRYNGCPIPDTDQDGINDEEDSCKTIPGPRRYNGCPIPDRDQDGLNDEVDGCPDQPGPPENRGCPVIKPAMKSRAQLVAANVIFQSNSAKLAKSSYPAIRELADSMQTNPELELLIEGYTDNTGNPAYNQKLSMERSEAVKKVLVNMGVSELRIQAKGFGQNNPIADNRTSAGKMLNRRVAFVFQLKNR